MKAVNENTTRVINNEEKEEMKYSGQDCLTAKEPQEELNMRTKVELNLQKPYLPRQQ
jgi:hypothetical protein